MMQHVSLIFSDLVGGYSMIFLLDFFHSTSYQVTASCSSKVPIPRTTPSSRRQPLQIPPETSNLTATAVQIAVQNWCSAFVHILIYIYIYMCVCVHYMHV